MVVPPETILENEYVTLVFHAEGAIVHHTFHKFVEGDAFRQALEKGVELLRENQATKWLSDDRKNAAVPQKDVAWAKSVWFPQAVAAGWKYWALLMPENVLGQMNMRRVTEPYAEQGIEVRLFEEPGEALAWLQRV